jgi:ATP-dependent Lhr-like helicase
MAATAKLRAERGIEAETMWSDDGFVLRIPEAEEAIEIDALLPSPAELKDLVLRQLGSTSMFAAKFREAAARALLLPKRRPGVRAPLWAQRKRAADLLAVASRYSSFPILLETYRECVRDVLDLASTTTVLREIQRGKIRVTGVDSEKPSPYASTLLFSYIANYIYEGDAPLAERRAQALAIDQSQLEEILGSTDLRELLDRAALEEVESRLQALDPDYHAMHADALHDMLLRLGDLSTAEIAARCDAPDALTQLTSVRRALAVRIAGETRYIAAEYAGRYRDALGVPLPPGLPEAFLEHTGKPLVELVRRYARTHGPFTTADVASRFGVQPAIVDAVLKSIHAAGKLLEGEFRPEGTHREWCDPEVLQQVRRKTLARLRREVEPAARQTFARLLTRWQGVAVPRRGPDALLDSVEILQGAALIASELERDILPARVTDYRLGDIDALLSSGEVVWVGRENLGERDGRIALYLAESLAKLLPPDREAEAELSERAQHVADFLARQGASFFGAIHQACGAGFPGDTEAALWELVWAGRITNDTLQPLRNLVHNRDEERARRIREGPPGSPEFLRRLRGRTGEQSGLGHGRWSLVRQRVFETVTPTEWSANLAQQLLARHGIVMREIAAAEGVPGGYPAIYPALKTMEESGWIRRGMFVAGLGAAQFAMTSAVDMLRSLRTIPEKPEAVHLAASDPANPYGAVLPWPPGGSMARAAGASVIVIDGELAAFVRRKNPAITVLIPDDEPDRSRVARELARTLAQVAHRWQGRRTGLLIGEINDAPARDHFLAAFLEDAGFVASPLGFQMRRHVEPIDA